MISLIGGIFKKKKKIQMNFCIKQKQTHRLRELTVTRGEGCKRGIAREFGMDMYPLPY